MLALFGAFTPSFAPESVEGMLAAQAQKFEAQLLEQGKLIAAQAKRLDELEAHVSEMKIISCDDVHGCVDSRAGMDGCRTNTDLSTGSGNVTCGTRR